MAVVPLSRGGILQRPVPYISQSTVWRSRNPPALFFTFGSNRVAELPYLACLSLRISFSVRTNSFGLRLRISLCICFRYSANVLRLPQMNRASINDMHGSMSVLAISRHSRMVRKLCATSMPASRRRCRKFCAAVAPGTLAASSAMRNMISTSDEKQSSFLPYPPSATTVIDFCSSGDNSRKMDCRNQS
jgi:hypothetical protein